jgi:hypothetical protein
MSEEDETKLVVSKQQQLLAALPKLEEGEINEEEAKEETEEETEEEAAE